MSQLATGKLYCATIAPFRGGQFFYRFMTQPGFLHHLLRVSPARLALCAIGLLAGTVHAENPDVVQDLYREALRSIAEGHRDDASDALERVIAQEPLHAGAWLDLALIRCDLGNMAEAERLFQAIEQRFAPPPEIRELIAQARAGGCAGWQPRPLYSVTVGRGYSRNVNQGANSATYQPVDGGDGLVLLPDFLPQSDQYSLLSADYIRDLTPNGTQGFVQLQDRRHDSLHRYDSTSLFAGIDTPWRYRRWKLRTTVTLGYATLGSQLYQRQVQLQAQAMPPLPLPKTLQLSLHTALTHVDYRTLDNFRGTTGEVRTQLTWRSGTQYASASLGLLDDKAAEDRPGGNRHGNSLALQYRQLLPGNGTGELGYTRQTWRSASAYAAGLIDQTRRQTAQTLRATYTHPLSKNQNLVLEARRVHNQENISIFQYDDSQLQLSWQWLSP
jgi:tetratricopeptide (TPR) repeat protein